MYRSTLLSKSKLVIFVNLINEILQIATIISLVLLYLLPSIGLTISRHYCGGELSSVSALPFHKHTCGCGDKAMDKNCCKDELTIIKIEDDQSKTQVAEVSFESPSFSSPIYLDCKTKVFSDFDEPYRVLDDPPDQAKNQKIFIRIQSFLI